MFSLIEVKKKEKENYALVIKVLKVDETCRVHIF